MEGDRRPSRAPGWWVALQVGEFVLCLGAAAALFPFVEPPVPIGLWIAVIGFLVALGALNVWLWRRFVRT